MYEQNKQICRKLLEEAWGGGNLKAVNETVSSKCRLHDPAFPSLGAGAESLKEHIVTLREAFPDLSCTCDDVIAERDEVVVHWTCRGTNRGRFLNNPATNRSIMISGTSIHRLEDNKIVELWIEWNLQALLDQLGLGMTEMESNKALARRFFEDIWNRKKPDMISHFVSDDYVRHSPSGILKGARGLRQDYDTYVTAFPNCHLQVEEMISEGDKVMVRYTVNANQTGKLMDYPASGKPITFSAIVLLRIAKGKIAEESVVWDRLALMQQIGAVGETARTAKSTK